MHLNREDAEKKIEIKRSGFVFAAFSASPRFNIAMYLGTRTLQRIDQAGLHSFGSTDTNGQDRKGAGLSAGSEHGGVKFNLIDSVIELTDQRIVATKHVSLAEEYLADHFPTFPVLPGVMMLEAATQAAGWLMHHRTDFGKSMAVLKEARNVKYGHFVAPGHHLTLDVQYSADTAAGAAFKVSGTVDQHQALQAKLELAYFNLGERLPDRPGLDEKLSAHARAHWNLLWPATTSAVAV